MTGNREQLNILRWRSVMRSRAFKRLFNGPDGKVSRDGRRVLADLIDFCRVQKTTFSSDPLMMARMEGRREVMLRIMNYLDLDEAVVRQIMEIDDDD